MGISPSKRVSQTLSNSPEFNPSCDSVFQDSISKSQFAFPGIKPYQLLSATQNLHHLLLPSLPIISKWVPSPPDRTQVDQAYQKVLHLRFTKVQEKGQQGEGQGECLGRGEEVESLDRGEKRCLEIEDKEKECLGKDGEAISRELTKFCEHDADKRQIVSGEGECLDREEFRVFALEVFSNVVVSRAGSEMMKMVPIGVVGIGGVGVVVKANGGVLGAAIGTYVLAVATRIYLGLAV